MDKTKRAIIFITSFFIITISVSQIFHYYAVKNDYEKEVNFLVSKRVITLSHRCKLYDKNKIKLPIKSYTFYDNSEVLTGDSIVKKSKSNILYIYRKKVENSNDYSLVKKIELK